MDERELSAKLREWGFGLTVTELGEHTDADNWDHRKYRLTLKYEGRRITFEYRQGMGIDRRPTIAAAFHAVLMDAEFGYMTFEEFCGELGYDTDSRRAERNWQAGRSMRTRVGKLLGSDYQRYTDGDRQEWRDL